MAIRTTMMAAAMLVGMAAPGVATAQGYPGTYPGYGYGGGAYRDGYRYDDRREEQLLEKARRHEAKERYLAWKRAHPHEHYRDAYGDRY